MALPVKAVRHHRDGVLHPVPFAHDAGADHRLAGVDDDRLVFDPALDLVGQQVQRPPSLARKPAMARHPTFCLFPASLPSNPVALASTANVAFESENIQ